MKKIYVKPTIETVVINTEAIAGASILSAASVKQSGYKTLEISSRLVREY
ncbi:MAG: hypothetical protein LIO87_02210 [Eubacterium sp.]|nr:hypothetical protein [Eubacterium sp.]